MNGTRRPQGYVLRCSALGFFICFFLFMSSGRLGSFDAGQQLSATTLLATTGNLGIKSAQVLDGWVPSPNGLIYEAHDPGAIALMLPSAWIAAKLSHAPVDVLFHNPPILAKLGVSLTYAMVSAVGCWFLFLLFCDFYNLRESFFLTLLFITGTFFLPYAKMAWDVAPAAAMMCAVLYFANAMLRTGATTRTYAAAGVAVALACTLRYSLAPFIAVSFAYLLWHNRPHFLKYLLLATTVLVCMVPTFIYNEVRTGSPLRPATATDFYLRGNNSLDGNILLGLRGLMIDGNHGLLWCAPIMLLILLLPILWRRMPRKQRLLIASMLGGAVLYTVLIAKMVNWGAFGWGPRYLLPCLPIFFLAAVPGFMALKHRMPAVAALVVIVVVALNVAPSLTNWNVVASEFPGAALQNPGEPYFTEGMWIGFWQNIHGQNVVFGATDRALAARDNSRRFPDLWTARLLEGPRSMRIAGVAIILALLFGMATTLRIIWRGSLKREERAA